MTIIEELRNDVHAAVKAKTRRIFALKQHGPLDPRAYAAACATAYALRIVLDAIDGDRDPLRLMALYEED